MPKNIHKEKQRGCPLLKYLQRVGLEPALD